jgi:hypothetical protein
LITTLQGWATDVLHGIPKGMEDRFGGDHFAVAYLSQLKVRTEKVGKSMQDFVSAIEQLAHRAYTTLPEDHIRREARKAFVDGVEDRT